LHVKYMKTTKFHFELLSANDRIDERIREQGEILYERK
jgi:hypothetical protein